MMRLLSKRETQVSGQVSQGLSNRTIAENLSITEHTVKKHIQSICSKLHLKNKKEIMLYVMSGK